MARACFTIATLVALALSAGAAHAQAPFGFPHEDFGKVALSRAKTVAGEALEVGVGHVRLADPDLKTLEVLELTGGKWLLTATFKDDDPVAAAPFEVRTFSLAFLSAHT
ncbi:MAG: hypothetical protein GC150_17455 [Rhizobiales bacterium]|nr:hypothetical protein [Hyphomicrobiales bacterium]